MWILRLNNFCLSFSSIFRTNSSARCNKYSLIGKWLALNMPTYISKNSNLFWHFEKTTEKKCYKTLLTNESELSMLHRVPACIQHDSVVVFEISFDRYTWALLFMFQFLLNYREFSKRRRSVYSYTSDHKHHEYVYSLLIEPFVVMN